MNKALLFINGLEPKNIPSNLSDYSLRICTDGAFRYVKNFPFSIDYLSGDLDSVELSEVPEEIKIIHTPDQNKTDFEKALEFIIAKGITAVDVYGATGLEHDHFIGNLSTALNMKDKIRITFFDDYSQFFFSGKRTSFTDVKGKIISLIPFFKAEKIITKGLEYPLYLENLTFGDRIGTRNRAIENEVQISYENGELLIYRQI